MHRHCHNAVRALLACLLLALSCAPVCAAEPGVRELDAAIATGDFKTYSANLSTWLAQKTPAEAGKITPESLTALLKAPAFEAALAQKQFIGKVGVDKLGAFAKTDEASRRFVAWILKDTSAMELYLEGATPIKISAKEDNSWSIPTGALEIWKKIYLADPESRQGLYLRLAMATSLRPPGTGNRGAGMQEKPSDPLVRYKYFKDSHRKGELFPSFDKLGVWELTHVVSSPGSEADLTWGREMVNTWMPQVKEGERVVETTSQVWRRNSPIPFSNGYKSVMEGGGKCGPRSSWSVFICQAWGVPAIGVGQPQHACVAYKTANGWQVAYGRGWNASRLEGMSGEEFVQGVDAREPYAVFSKVEHLRWLSQSLPKEQSAAVMNVASAIAKSTPAAKRDLAASERADEADADGAALGAWKAAAVNKAVAAAKAPPPIRAQPGVIHVEGDSFFSQGGEHCFGGQFRGVPVIDSTGGGKQLNFQALMATAWVGYKINVPETGVYELTAKIATVNSGQSLHVRSFGAMAPIKQATASTVYKNMVKDLGPQQAVDNDPGTRWAVSEGIDKCWLELDLGKPTTISACMIDERAWNRVSQFQVEYKVGDQWKKIFDGTNIGIDFAKDFPPVTAQHVRLNIIDNRQGGPTIWEFNVGTIKDGRAWLNLPCTYGLWQTTKPVDIRLVKGAQTIWIFAPYQRGVTLKHFDLRRKGGYSSGVATQSPSAPSWLRKLPSELVNPPAQ